MEYVKKARVLAVDDDPGSRKLMASILGTVGCDVTPAGSGAEALKAIDEGRWDVVLLDVNMPGISGFDVLGRIRLLYEKDALPVIMVTGQDDVESRLRALDLGADDFVNKPVDQAELLARIGNVLALHWAWVRYQEQVAALEKARDEVAARCREQAQRIRALLGTARDSAEAALAAPVGSVEASLRGSLFAIDRAIDAANHLAAPRPEEAGPVPAGL